MEEGQVAWLIILDHAAWEVLQVEVISPLHQWLRNGRQVGEAVWVSWRRSGPPVTAFVALAARGFRGVAPDLVRRVAALMEVPQAGVSLAALLFALMRKLLPGKQMRSYRPSWAPPCAMTPTRTLRFGCRRVCTRV